MSLDTLRALRDSYPNEREALDRFADLVSQTLDEGGRELSFDLIYDTIEPNSHSALANIVGDLVEAGVLLERVKVMSRGFTGGVIQTYSSIYEVPHLVIDDLADGREMSVTPHDLRLVYCISEPISA